MQKGKIAAYLGVCLAACGIILGGAFIDSALAIGGVFRFVAEIAVTVGSLLWLTWHGSRPRGKKGFLPYAWLGLIPAVLHVMACFGPLNGAKLPLDYIWGGITTLSGVLWQTFLLLGVGGSLMIQNGKVHPTVRGVWIFTFALPHLVFIAATPSAYATHLLGAMVALAMGAFLTVVYEHSGRLWMVLLLAFAYELAEVIFQIGSRNFAYLGGAVYYCILICNIMLYAVGAVYLARHAKGKPTAKAE